jgi:hypothetical protein
MIRIKKSTSADTRSAEKLVSRDELLENSKQHISDVQNGIDWMIGMLRDVMRYHDYTKIKNIDEFHKDFALVQDGKTNDFKKMNWFMNCHLKERHHLNDRCPEDVNLFDVLERIADITMAGMARTGKIYDDKLSNEILTKAYKNTIELLKSNIEIELPNP